MVSRFSEKSNVPFTLQRTKSAPKKASQSGGGAAVIARNRNAQGKAGQKEHSVTLSLSAESFLHDTQWKAAFLPSLIHSFFVSKEPLKHFKQSSEELHSLVQGVFNLSFPHVRYEITAKDKVLRTVSMAVPMFSRQHISNMHCRPTVVSRRSDP